MSQTSPAATDATANSAHAALLWLLLGVFCFRVVAQLAAAVIPLAILPPFEAWHSNALPYPVLVTAQVAIIAVYARMARGISSGNTRPRPRMGRILLAFGGVYFAFMLARLILGATLLSELPWWSAHIPSSFHLVLASFLIVAGHFHASRR